MEAHRVPVDRTRQAAPRKAPGGTWQGLWRAVLDGASTGWVPQVAAGRRHFALPHTNASVGARRPGRCDVRPCDASSWRTSGSPSRTVPHAPLSPPCSPLTLLTLLGGLASHRRTSPLSLIRRAFRCDASAVAPKLASHASNYLVLRVIRLFHRSVGCQLASHTIPSAEVRRARTRAAPPAASNLAWP